MSIKLVESSAFQWETCQVDDKKSSTFSRTVISATRTVRSARLWKPSHLRLFVDQVINRKRNERANYSDDEYLKEAVAWLERAQDARLDGGVSGGYGLGQGWRLSCLKATASSIPTFLRLADEWGNSRFVERAKRCVEFLLSTQLDCGAFPRGEIGGSERAPSPFNSAQIIAALLAWHQHTGDERSHKAAIRAADWLVSLQESDEVVGKGNNSELTGVYSAYVASCMAELGAFLKQEQYLAACADEGAQLKQVCDAKQTASAPHNDDRIDGSEVREVFWNRSRAAVMMLEIQTVLGQSFPGTQLF